jgi:hypothetical protein
MINHYYNENNNIDHLINHYYIENNNIDHLIDYQLIITISRVSHDQTKLYRGDKQWINESMNEWMNEWMNESINFFGPEMTERTIPHYIRTRNVRMGKFLWKGAPEVWEQFDIIFVEIG